MEDQTSQAIKKLEEYYAAMEARDEAEKVMQGHAMRAKQHADVLVALFDGNRNQVWLLDEVVWKLKNGKWPRRKKRRNLDK